MEAIALVTRLLWMTIVMRHQREKATAAPSEPVSGVSVVSAVSADALAEVAAVALGTVFAWRVSDGSAYSLGAPADLDIPCMLATIEIRRLVAFRVVVRHGCCPETGRKR